MKLILSALLAGLISFAWSFVSWRVMTWHEQGVNGFKDEAAVKEVIKANADHGTGIYQLPYPQKPISYAGPDAVQKQKEAYETAHSEGPYLYAILRPGRHDWSLTTNLGWSLGRSILAALLLGVLLHQTVLPFAGRLAFCAAAGLFAGLTCILPQKIWLELPQRDLVMGVADYVIEWTLAGLVLSLFLGREPTHKDFN